jgi:hypothetical protein
MPSDSDRRPKGVVNAFPVCIVFHLLQGKGKLLIKTMPKTLDSDSGKCDSLVARHEKGFRDGNVRELFSLRVNLLFSLQFPIL